MPISLRPGVSFCAAGDRFVFLDLPADRYFCLTAADQQAFADLLAAGADADPQTMARLQAIGLLSGEGAPEAIAPVAPPARPRLSLLDEPLGAPGFGELAAMAWQLTSVAIELNLAGLARTVAHAAAAKRSLRPRAAGSIEPTLAALLRFDRLVSAHDRCLVRGLALGRRLFARGQAAEIVFGVKLQPFRAHCWVQQSDALINERMDVAGLFTPILVI